MVGTLSHKKQEQMKIDKAMIHIVVTYSTLKEKFR